MDGFERPTHKHDELVFDVGMHKGEDTDYYLRKGFSVVGFEANPELVAYCAKRFENEIRDGRLSIIEGAIVPPDYRDPEIVFYKNRRSVYGTINSAWAERNEGFGATSTKIKVAVTDLAKVLEEHGSPYYMKVDIEGADLDCVERLGEVATRPDYVSLESNKVSLEEVEREISVLQGLGYDRFMAVQQAAISRQTEELEDGEVYRFESGSSGRFGPSLKGEWLDADRLLEVYRDIFRQYRRFGDDTVWTRMFPLRAARALILRLTGIALPGWYDTHARHSTASQYPLPE